MKFRLILSLLPTLYCFCTLGCSNNARNENEQEPASECLYFTEHLELFKYKFQDITGFELGEEFEKLYEEGYINFGEGCTLTLMSGDLTLKIPNDLEEEVTEEILSKFKEFAGEKDSWERGTIGTIKDLDYFSTPPVENRLLIGGVKFGKIWFGLFDKTTKELINEWTDYEVLNREVTINLGYGKTQKYIIDNHLIADYPDNIHYNNDGEMCALISPYAVKAVFMHGGTLKSVDVNATKDKKEGCRISGWYEGSVLITLSDNRRLGCGNVTYYIYKTNGEFVAKFSEDTSVSVPVYEKWIFHNVYNIHPCDYDEAIEITPDAIKKYTIDSESNRARITWETTIGNFKELSGPLVLSSSLISQSGDFLEMTAKAIEYSGKSVEIHFSLNAANGEIEFFSN